MARKSFRDLTRAQQLARGPIDLPFLMLTLLLLAIGLLMLLSASSYAALYDPAAGYQVEDGVAQMGDALYYFKHQLIYAVLGVLVLWLVSRLDYQRWRAWAVPILCVAVVLLILVLTPLGVNVNGATRWLKLLLVVGPTYQPSEIAKLGIVLVFAAGMSKRKNQPPRLRRKDPIWKNQLRSFLYWSDLGELLPYVGILIVIALLMLKEPHMSGTILVLAAAAAILFTAGIKLGWFALGGGLMGVIMALIVFVGGYNSDRIKTWQNPWWDPGDKGYQIVQSLYAVASGGLTGLGFGQSRQKYLYLPEEQNDFIFAIICEELGFIGAALIIILFALLIIRGYWLALHARDRFGSLLIVGITTLLAVQVFLNMAVVHQCHPGHRHFAALLQLRRHRLAHPTGGDRHHIIRIPADTRTEEGVSGGEKETNQNEVFSHEDPVYLRRHRRTHQPSCGAGRYVPGAEPR